MLLWSQIEFEEREHRELDSRERERERGRAREKRRICGRPTVGLDGGVAEPQPSRDRSVMARSSRTPLASSPLLFLLPELLPVFLTVLLAVAGGVSADAQGKDCVG